jgi:hypothetical protein
MFFAENWVASADVAQKLDAVWTKAGDSTSAAEKWMQMKETIQDAQMKQRNSKRVKVTPLDV